jgi:hypothetical protein
MGFQDVVTSWAISVVSGGYRPPTTATAASRCTEPKETPNGALPIYYLMVRSQDLSCTIKAFLFEIIILL